MIDTDNYRYFVSYSGVKLPLKLVNEITLENLHNRNTFFRSTYDAQGNMLLCQKIVYGEVDLEHRYSYNAEGKLISAQIIDGEEVRQLLFE
jgi:hypothetical protein